MDQARVEQFENEQNQKTNDTINLIKENESSIELDLYNQSNLLPVKNKAEKLQENLDKLMYNQKFVSENIEKLENDNKNMSERIEKLMNDNKNMSERIDRLKNIYQTNENYDIVSEIFQKLYESFLLDNLNHDSTKGMLSIREVTRADKSKFKYYVIEEKFFNELEIEEQIVNYLMDLNDSKETIYQLYHEQDLYGKLLDNVNKKGLSTVQYFELYEYVGKGDRYHSELPAISSSKFQEKLSVLANKIKYESMSESQSLSIKNLIKCLN